MANRNLNARQQQKHDTSSNFNSKNATYLEGEILIESDTGRVKIADGDTDYKTLPYTIGTRVPTDAKFTDTTYTASGGLSLSGTTFSIANSGVTADTYGPTANVSGSWGTSFTVPSVVVNTKGQVTNAVDRTVTMPSKPTAADIGAEPAFTKNTAFNKNFGTASGTVCEGDDERLSNARPASDVSEWAKAATKPTYTPTEVGVIGTAPTSGQVAVFDGTTGKIKSTGFTIASSVPAGAKFTDTTYSKATDSSLGLVQVGYETSGKNYAVTLDASGNAYVNVPWTDTNTTYSQATSGTLGLIKIGYTESGKNYPVELNSSGQAFVNVPWTDSVANNPAITITQNGVSKGSFTLNQTTAETIALTDTTYSVFKAATSSAAGGTGLVPAPDSGEQTSFLRGDGTWAVPAQPTVNNPTITIKQAGATKGTFTLNQSGAATIELTDNNTTYAQATSTVLGLVKIGYAENGRNYPIELDSLGKMFVNVPWTDTTYSLATVSANGLMPKIPSSSAQYLNGMGQWSTPPDTKYTNFVGSGSEAKSGLVPSPGTIAGTTKYLREDGTWSVPPDTTYIAGRAIEISQGAISVTNSGVSSGAYGLTDSTSVNIGTSFTVPGFVVDQYGRLTQAYSKTVTVNAPNMTGATTSAAGTAGLVPTPTAGKPTRYLCSTGEWSIPTGTIYNGSTTISVKPSTTDGEYNIYLVALFPGTTSQSVGPSASGTIDFGSAFNVPYITIDQYGRITALANRSMILSGALASSSAPGLCPKLDSSHPSYYLNANGSWSLPTGRVYGVKGEAETDYREGQVNITAANVGALALTGGTVSGSTTFSSNVTINGELNYDDGFY